MLPFHGGVMLCPFATSGVMLASCAPSCLGLIVAQNESAAQLLPLSPHPTLRRPQFWPMCTLLGLRWRCHSTCSQVEAASSWDRTNTPAGRAGPGQDSCSLVPCLHKHTAAAGVSSLLLLAGCANAPGF